MREFTADEMLELKARLVFVRNLINEVLEDSDDGTISMDGDELSEISGLVEEIKDEIDVCVWA